MPALQLQVLATALAIWAVLFGPGLVIAHLLGLRGIARWACAPALTCSLVGLAGALVALAGIRWSVAVLLGVLVAAGLVAVVVARLLPEPVPGRAPRAPERAGAIGGVVIGGVAIAVAALHSMGSVHAVPAQPDATYHLNSIRNMVITGDISSRDGGAFLYGRPHSFYPSTFHGLAATAGMMTHAQPVVLANLLALAVMTTVWTSGSVLLARLLFGPRRAALVLAGLAAASFTAMPFLIAGYGPLWPLLLGLALLPSLLAALVSLLGLGRRDPIGRPRAAVFLAAAVAGLAFVHPDALAGLALLGYVAVAGVAITALIHRPGWRRGAALAVAVIGPPVLWLAVLQLPRARAMTRAYAVGPTESRGRALSEVLLNNPRFGAPLWVTSALVLVGIWACLRRPRLRWLAAAYVVAALIFFGVVAVQSRFTQGLTVFWYNDPPRLAALVPVVGVPVLTAGLLAVGRLHIGRIHLRRLPGAVVFGLVVVVGVALSFGPHVDRLRPYYQPRNPLSALLTRQEAAALQVLARSVPADAVVADNPWRGQALLYAFGSRRVAFYSEKAVTTTDRQTVADGLDLAASPQRPDVCTAVRRLGIGYVLTGGANQLPNLAGRDTFAGIDGVGMKPQNSLLMPDDSGPQGFIVVAEAAPYTLWRITACG